MPSRLLPILFAVVSLCAAPTAQAFTEASAKGRAGRSSPALSFWTGNFSPSETKHPGLSAPRGAELRWGTLGPARDGGFRFGARLSSPAGTWTLDHSDGNWRGRAAHRFRLGFSRKF